MVKPLTGYLLKHAQALLRARMDEALRPLGLTVSQYSCLYLLQQDPGISASDLARGAFVSRQSMNALLQTLLDRGLVERPARVTSGRARPADLTVAGTQLLGQAQTLVDAVQERMLSGLSEPEIAHLERGLASCVDALSDPVE